jgi:hypothetical protein
MNLAGLVKAAVKNPQAFGAVAGAVLGLIVGLIAYVLFHHYSLGTWAVAGIVIGAVLGWWQRKSLAGMVARFLLKRLSPL